MCCHIKYNSPLNDISFSKGIDLFVVPFYLEISGLSEYAKILIQIITKHITTRLYRAGFSPHDSIRTRALTEAHQTEITRQVRRRHKPNVRARLAWPAPTENKR